MRDYNQYIFNKKEICFEVITFCILLMVVGYIFYDNIMVGAIFIIILPIYLKSRKKKKITMRKWKLNLEFKDGLQSLNAALNTGYSIENSFMSATMDLLHIYHEEAFIVQEFRHITNQIKFNQTVEKLLLDFGDRTQIEDIKNFAEVFSTAKRTGGNIIKIIQSCSSVIGDKIEVKREIQTLVTAKKYESRIMNLIPIGIVGYLRICTPEFLNPLYHNLLGIVVMSVCLIIYVFAFWLSQKIINIEV